MRPADRKLLQPFFPGMQPFPSGYLEIEGWMEEKMAKMQGDFQGGAIDVLPSEHAHAWRDKIQKKT